MILVFIQAVKRKAGKEENTNDPKLNPDIAEFFWAFTERLNNDTKLIQMQKI